MEPKTVQSDFGSQADPGVSYRITTTGRAIAVTNLHNGELLLEMYRYEINYVKPGTHLMLFNEMVGRAQAQIKPEVVRLDGSR